VTTRDKYKGPKVIMIRPRNGKSTPEEISSATAQRSGFEAILPRISDNVKKTTAGYIGLASTLGTQGYVGWVCLHNTMAALNFKPQDVINPDLKTVVGGSALAVVMIGTSVYYQVKENKNSNMPWYYGVLPFV
jgi:hypothetical protein